MAQIFGIKFAPLSIPFHRRVETFAVCFQLFMFFAAPFLSIFLTLYLLFYTRYWWLVLLYGIWFVYDFNTPQKGGRRFEWFRKIKFWCYYRDYFPLSLIKTVDLDASKNYIFGVHPHGIISMGAANLFGTDAGNLSDKFKGLSFYLCTLKSQFYFPLRREYYLSLGGIEVSKESITYVLSKKPAGNAVVIIIGGAAEALDAYPGTYKITLNSRKGFIKIALQQGANLVPVIAFGENDLYEQVGNRSGSILRFLQKKLKGVYTYSLPFFYGRGVFNYSFGMLPFRKPVFMVVGKAIEVARIENPNQQEIDDLHSRYKQELLSLFEENKIKYGVDKSSQMVFI